MASGFTNPYAGIGTGSTRGSGFSYSPHAKIKAPSSSKGLTVNQYLQLQAAAKQSHHGSFLDEVKHAAHPVGWVFDKLLRPQYAVATAIDQGIHNGHFDVGRALHGAKEGVTGHSKEGFGQVLEHHGVLKGHRFLRGVAGLGLDIAADPLTYVSGGTSLLTKSAEHGALLAASKTALHGADDLEALSKAQKTLRAGGDAYKYRHALASERIRTLTKDVTKGATVPGEAADAGKLAILRESALAEQHRVEQRLPYYKVGTRKHGLQITPTHVAGKRVVPALPKLDNFIAAGKVGSGAAEVFRNHFIRSAGESPETHAALITQRHLAEQYAQHNLSMLRGHFKGFNISKKKALAALHFGETHKNFLIKTKKGYRINEGVISKLMREGKLDAEQVKFLRRWHQATEFLYKRDKAMGLDYRHVGEDGHLYVPHLVDKSGHPLSDVQVNRLTEAGFQRARSTKNFSVAQLAEKHAAGELGRGVETDPFTLLAHTARSRANKQADQTLINAFAGHMGIKTRVVDAAKLAKRQSKLAQLGMEVGVHQAAHASELADAHTKEQMFLANHEFEHAQKMQDIAAQIRSHKYRRNTVTKAATLARLVKRQNKLIDTHAKEVGQIARGRHQGLNDLLAPHVAAAAEHQGHLDELVKQQKGLQREIKKIAIGKQNRGVYSKVEHKTVSGIKDEFGHPLAFHPEQAHAIERYQKIATGNDQAIEDFSKGWRKWMANWKLAVTSVNPGYRIRNTMSDVWAMYVSGMSMRHINQYGAKAAILMRQAKRGEVNPEAMRQVVEMYHHGILSGLYQGDVQAIGKMIQYSGAKSSLAKQGKFIKLSTKIMQDMNANVENWGRVTHYLYRRQHLGESAVQAAQGVKKAHFDYEDLTPFEQKVMKGIAPFYTWTRKNVPFQIKALIEHPGRYAAFPKTMQESEYASGGDPGNIVPGYISQGLGFQIPFGKHNYYLPQIGAADLQLFDSKGGAVQRLAGLTNPALRIPFEIQANKNLFTGAQIASDTHTRNPVSNLGADLLSLIPGSNVGQTARTVNGKRVTGPGANPYYQYLLGQIPLARELGINGPGSIQRHKGVPPEASYLGGQSVQNVNPAEQQMIAQINIANQVKKETGGLRDAGILPPTKHKRPKAGSGQAAINRMIRISEGRK